MKTKCICNCRFDADVRERTIKNGIEDIYYMCPRCGEYYHIAYINDAIRKNMEDIKKIKLSLRQENSQSLQELLQKKMNLNKELTENMERMMANG
jgi:hypothetical protein